MVKKTEGTESIESGKQKALKTISKILEIFAIIGKVCIWIGLVCVVIAAIAFPLIMRT